MADGRGQGAADRWYWSQVRAAIVPSLHRRLRSATAAPVDTTWNVRLAARALRRRPGLVIASVATLGLGIGAASAIFSVAEAVLLRPLPFPDGERLVQVWNTYDTWRGHEVLDAFWDEISLSYPEYEELKAEQTVFEEVAIYGTSPLPMTGRGDAREVLVGTASASLFPLLGASPVVGRSFAPDEEGEGAPRVTVLAHHTWRDDFGSDPEVLGRTLTLGGDAFAVIGVLPEGFHLGSIGFPGHEPHVAWTPVGVFGGLSRGNHWYEGLGLLKEDVTLAPAAEESARILRGDSPPEARNARLVMRKDAEVGDAGGPLLLLITGVAVLLLIACGNFATLMLGEANRRRGELGTRMALGAGRGRLVTQMVTESTLLGLAGGLAGVVLAWWALGAFTRLSPGISQLAGPVGLDARLLTIGLALGLLTGALFGLVPALAVRVEGVARGRPGAAGETLSGRRTQRLVLGTQVALAVVLLVTGGLLTRSVGLLSAVEPGFDAVDLWSARVAISGTMFSDDDARQRYHQIVEALRAQPGIDDASLVSTMPFAGGGGSSSFDIVGREVGPDDKQPEAFRVTVTPGYHEMLGIPLREGRHLTQADRIYDAPVIVVSETLSDQYFPGGDAVGSFIRRDSREWAIVGVVADVHQADLSQPPQSTFYVPFDVAETPFGMTVVAKAALSSEQIAAAVRETVRAHASDVPVEDIESTTGLIARSTLPQRFRSWLLTAFALVSTLLCAIGLFGVTMRAMTSRRRELGIRLALGARPGDLIRKITVEELGTLLGGLLTGTVAALVLGGLLAGFLFGVTPRDPTSFAFGAMVMTLASLGATILGARRGVALDPVEAIRAE